MKAIFTVSIAAILLFTASSFAVFSAGSSATFDNGLTGWHKSGDVKAIGEFAELGKLGTNSDSTLWTSFTVPTTGQYAMTFDYRFTGVDNFAPADDFATAGIGQGKNALDTVYKADSSAGLTGGLNAPGDWHTATSQPVTLEAGQKYWLGFELNESPLSHHDQLITFLNVDNVAVMKVPAVPAPGAILLSCIGAGFVGWLRYRRALS